jgi:hypothetical protein
MTDQNLTRFEVIDTEGRAVVHYGPVRMDVQDEGRTLKVFVDRPLSRPPTTLTEEERESAKNLIAEALLAHHVTAERKAEEVLAALLERYELRRR